jgi:hypothetical protein
MRALLMGLILLSGTARAQIPLPANPAVAGPVVVELFTSQGCSSCPPADAMLRELAVRPEVLALGFHVTYWNGLGWRDPFSLDIATLRQRQYQRALHIETVYTPQIVVQGMAEMVGSDRQAVAHAIGHAATSLARDPGPTLRLARTSSGLAVDVGAGQGSASLILIGYDRQHHTSVARGENGGRELVEANVVRSLQNIAHWDGTKLSLIAPVPAGEQATILLQAPDGRILSAAVAQTAGEG